MNEHIKTDYGLLEASEPDDHGRFFRYAFDERGYATDDPAAATWTWRSYRQGDARARQEIVADPALPEVIRLALLTTASDSHIDFDDGWLHGDLPDLRHDYSKESRGLSHFRFAFNERMLVGARKQPLRSVDAVRTMIEKRQRPFRSPAAVIEAIVNQSLAGMGVEINALGDLLDGIEDRIVCDDWRSERQTLVEARRKLVVIHRQMAALNSLFKHLDQAHRDDLPDAIADMTARLSHHTYGLHYDSEQLQARARLLQDELMANLTAQSNRLLYVLSVMTAVLLPATIISGLFGMNVGGLPFMGQSDGFWVVTGLSVAVAAGTLYAVRRIGDRM